MTNPELRRKDSKGNYYTRPSTGEKVPSVTQILKDGIPKPALTYWGPKMCGEFVADNLELVIQTHKSTNGRAMVVDLVKGSPYRESDVAKDIGSLVHEIAEAHILGLPIPIHDERHAGFVRSFKMFIEDWRPEFLHTEMTGFNMQYGYGGTLDSIIKADGKTWLIDWKTGKPGQQGHAIYPETALQLTAYRNAEFVVLPNGAEIPMPQVDACAAVNLRPNGYKFVPVVSDEAVFRTFLYVMQVAKFQQQGADLIGEPLAPPIREEVAS